MKSHTKPWAKYSLLIYLILGAAVLFFAIEAKRKYVDPNNICQTYSEGQNIAADVQLEMNQLAAQGARVKIKTQQNEQGPYPSIELFAMKGKDLAPNPSCSIHIQDSRVIKVEYFNVESDSGY